MILRLVLSFYFLCLVSGNSWTRKYSNSPQESTSGDDQSILCAKYDKSPEALPQNLASESLSGTRKELDDHTHSEIENRAEKESTINAWLELIGLSKNSENATTASDKIETSTDQDFTLFFQDEPSSEQDETRRDMNIIIPDLTVHKNVQEPPNDKGKCFSALNLKRVVKGVLEHIKKHPDYVNLLIQELQLEIEKETLNWFDTSSILNQYQHDAKCPPQLMTLAEQTHTAYLQLKEFQPCLDVMFGYVDVANLQESYVKETSPDLGVLIATLPQQTENYVPVPQPSSQTIHLTVPEVNSHQVQYIKPIPDVTQPQFIIEEVAEASVTPTYIEPEYVQAPVLEQQLIEIPQYVEPQYIEPVNIEPQTITPQYVELQNVIPTDYTPVQIEPQTIDPQYLEAQIINPDYNEPLVIQPHFIEPQVQQPLNTEPNFLSPHFIMPTVIEQHGFQPQFVEHEFSEPIYLEQQILQPQNIEPQVIEPQYVIPLLPTEPYITPDETSPEKSPQEAPSPIGNVPEKEKPDSKPELNPKSDSSPQEQPRPFLEPENQPEPHAHSWPFTEDIVPGPETELYPEILIEPKDYTYVDEPKPVYEQPIYYDEPVHVEEPVYYEEPIYVEDQDNHPILYAEPKPTLEPAPIEVEAPIDMQKLKPLYVETKPTYETEPLPVTEPNREPIYIDKPVYVEESPSIFIEPTSTEIYTEEPQTIYVKPTPIFNGEPINEQKPTYLEQPEYIFVEEPTNQYKPIFAEEPTNQKPNNLDEPEHIYIQEPTTEYKPIILEESPQVIFETPTNEPKPIYVEKPENIIFEETSDQEIPVYVRPTDETGLVYVIGPTNEDRPIDDEVSSGEIKPIYVAVPTNTPTPLYDETPTDTTRPIYVEIPDNDQSPIYIEEPSNENIPVYIEQPNKDTPKENSWIYYDHIPSNDYETSYVEEPMNEQIPSNIEEPTNKYMPIYDDYSQKLYDEPRPTVESLQYVEESIPIYIKPAPKLVTKFDVKPTVALTEETIYVEDTPINKESIYIKPTPQYVGTSPYVDNLESIYIEPTPTYDQEPKPTIGELLTTKYVPMYYESNTPTDNGLSINIQENEPNVELLTELPTENEPEPTYQPILIYDETSTEELTTVDTLLEPTHESKLPDELEFIPPLYSDKHHFYLDEPKPLHVEPFNVEPTYIEDAEPNYVDSSPNQNSKPSGKLKLIPTHYEELPHSYDKEPNLFGVKPLHVEPIYIEDSGPNYVDSSPNQNMKPSGKPKFIPHVYQAPPYLHGEEPYFLDVETSNEEPIYVPNFEPHKPPNAGKLKFIPSIYSERPRPTSTSVEKLILQLIRDNPDDLTETLVKILEQNRSALNPKLYKLIFALIGAHEKGVVDSKSIHKIIYFLLEPPNNEMGNIKKKQLLWHLLTPNENGQIDSEITNNVLMLINVPEKDSKSLILMDEILPLLNQIKNGHVAHKSIKIIQNLINGEKNRVLTPKQIHKLLLLIKPNKMGSIPKKRIDIAITLSNWNKIPYLDSNMIETIFSLVRPNKKNKIDNIAIDILHEILSPKKTTFLTQKDIVLILSFLKTKPGQIVHRKRLNLVLFLLKNFSRAPRLTDSFIKLLVDSDIERSKYVDIVLYLHRKRLLTLRLFETLISLIRQEQTGYTDDNNINKIFALLEPYRGKHPKIEIDIFNLLHPGDVANHNLNSNRIPENMKVLLYYLLSSGANKVPNVQSLQTPLPWKRYHKDEDQRMFKLNMLTKILQLLQWDQKKALATESQTHDYGVIELTYMLKEQKPLMYHPVYYVKYKVPVINFLANVKSLLASNSQLNIDPGKLLHELLIEGDVTAISPNLKGLRKEDILDLTFKDGNLIQAKVLDEKSLRLNEQVKLIHDINADVTPEEILNQIKLNALNYNRSGKLKSITKPGLNVDNDSNSGSLASVLQKISQQFIKKRPEASSLHMRSGDREEEEEEETLEDTRQSQNDSSNQN